MLAQAIHTSTSSRLSTRDTAIEAVCDGACIGCLIGAWVDAVDGGAVVGAEEVVALWVEGGGLGWCGGGGGGG